MEVHVHEAHQGADGIAQQKNRCLSDDIGLEYGGGHNQFDENLDDAGAQDGGLLSFRLQFDLVQIDFDDVKLTLFCTELLDGPEGDHVTWV